MFQRIHEKLGTAGFIISIVALVAALGGGAYAASAGPEGGQASASATGKQGPRGKQGKPGKQGKTGPAGPAGPQGPAGAAGAKGDTGAAGTNGTNGTNGTSVTGAPIAANTACGKKTGVKYTLGATSTNVCNGEDGVSGFTKTLPAGETETGTWNILASSTETFAPTELEAVSFSIPMAAAAETGFFFNLAQTELEEWGKTNLGLGCVVGSAGCTDTGCRGTATEPAAPAGVLCYYTLAEELVNTTGAIEARAPGGFGYGVSGSYLSGLFLEGSTAEPARAELHGTWAVTG